MGADSQAKAGGVRRMGGVGAGAWTLRALLLLALLPLGSCGWCWPWDCCDCPEDFAADFALYAEPSEDFFCCDPLGSFPQLVGTIYLDNDINPNPIDYQFEHGLGVSVSPSYGTLSAGSFQVVEVYAWSCSDFGQTVTLYERDAIVGDVIGSRTFEILPSSYWDRTLSVVDTSQRLRFFAAASLLLMSSGIMSPVGLPVIHSALGVPPKIPVFAHTEIWLVGMYLFALQLTQLQQLFGTGATMTASGSPVYPCGAGPNGFTVCPDMSAPMPEGEYHIAWQAVGGPIPLASATEHYQYAFVFDADGDIANNYIPAPAFPNDFFGGTDRWYELKYDPVNGWSLVVTDASDNLLVQVPSAARAIIHGDSITLLVPRGEMTDPSPSWRATAFCHDGTFGIPPPHDWSGDLEPPVAEGLHPGPD